MTKYYLKMDNIMKNMFVVALNDELQAQSENVNFMITNQITGLPVYGLEHLVQIVEMTNV